MTINNIHTHNQTRIPIKRNQGSQIFGIILEHYFLCAEYAMFCANWASFLDRSQPPPADSHPPPWCSSTGGPHTSFSCFFASKALMIAMTLAIKAIFKITAILNMDAAMTPKKRMARATALILPKIARAMRILSFFFFSFFLPRPSSAGKRGKICY